MPVMTYVLPWQSPTILQYLYPRQATWSNLYIDICEDCGNNYRQIPSFMILYNWFELFKNTFVSKVTMGFTKVPKVSTGFTEIPKLSTTRRVKILWVKQLHRHYRSRRHALSILFACSWDTLAERWLNINFPLPVLV